MFTSRNPRGATPIRNETSSLRNLVLLGNHNRMIVACGVMLSAIVSLGLFASAAPENPDESSTPQALIASASEQAASQVSAEPARLAEQEEIAPALPEIPWRQEVVQKGDNLSLIFKRAGFNDRDVFDVVTRSNDGKPLERIFPGQIIAFQSGEDNSLAAVRHTKSPLETMTYRRGEQGFESHLETRAPERRETWATGVIDSSLFLAGQDAGLSHNMIMELANVFGGVIDFVMDPRQGDTIQLIYEELYLDGEKFRDGEIVAASFTNRGETFNAFRYIDTDGSVNYYNEDGVSMRKAFLMSPVDFTRISSSFNLRRRHPIYKTTRAHRGIDYAASRGTPVFAAGDGRVTRAGYSKSNGNYVFIAHGEKYVTKYLHLHKRNVKQGQRVTQSQVIGTVGSTGAATGPHLHYEFLMNGVHRNPRTIHKKLPKAKSLPETEMARFEQAINTASTQLATLQADSHVAMNNANADAADAANH